MTPRSLTTIDPWPCACLLPWRLTLRSAFSTSCGYSTRGTFLLSTLFTFSTPCVWHGTACSPPQTQSPPPSPPSPPRSTLLSTRPQCPVTCALASSAATAGLCSASTLIPSRLIAFLSRVIFSHRRLGMAVTIIAAFTLLLACLFFCPYLQSSPGSSIVHNTGESGPFRCRLSSCSSPLGSSSAKTGTFPTANSYSPYCQPGIACIFSDTLMRRAFQQCTRTPSSLRSARHLKLS